MNRIMTPALTDSVLLTMDDVHRWRAEREKFMSEIEALKEKIEALDRRLDAAALFVHPDQLATISPATTSPSVSSGRIARGSWTSTIMHILDSAGRGMTYEE